MNVFALRSLIHHPRRSRSSEVTLAECYRCDGQGELLARTDLTHDGDEETLVHVIVPCPHCGGTGIDTTIERQVELLIEEGFTYAQVERFTVHGEEPEDLRAIVSKRAEQIADAETAEEMILNCEGSW